jgi:hypothetical protein
LSYDCTDCVMYAPSMHKLIPPPPDEYVTVAADAWPAVTETVWVSGTGV